MHLPEFGVLAFIASSQAFAQVALTTTRVIGPTASPIFIAQPPADPHRIYVINQSGFISLVKDGAIQLTPFLRVPTSGGGESGLLGFAFHPQYPLNRYFYVYYNGNSGPAGVHVVRYTTNQANPDLADPDSAYPILFIPRTVGLHVAGWIGFGPDGCLYIASGNALNGGNSGSLSTLLGKMLRIDVDRDDFPADPDRNYAIPPTNPLAGSATGLPEIWAYGLRNPWRSSFDRQTGDFWITDVGDSQAGEINFQPAGLSQLHHYGYPCMEGITCRGSTADCTCNSPTLTLPIYTMSTPGATIGGYVYRGDAIPGLQGTYFFADYSGKFWSFRFDGTSISELTDRTATFAMPADTVSSFSEDDSGELYICTRNSGIFKIVGPCPANCDNSRIEPRLTSNDFQCFLNKFAAGDSYANCDNSTSPPVLNAGDFQCFLNLYALGCS